ncbi:flavin reductase family protein [Thiomicrorhabdus sp. ZW0627]|uniref:flavin reductase family protein n=1 Tax=Thiomicrorhabdus sp. ZW0627 TaxID=3039774 RepID=UPI0024368055|nr:flavin reductase family protein [Thiomicrorhabdus sp. ZW0627]MDG6774223.1 flavin reductase family protein [Thiomicrorhabdus sp. ZW0627]
MFVESAKLSTPEIYPLLVGGIVPRPIAWVSTRSDDGIDNLAPYSFFTVASCNPPVLSVTQVNPGDRADKDTLSNLLQNGECVVNVVSSDLAEVMNASCADYPSQISEFEAVGIETDKSHQVSPLSVKQAKVRYECRLREVISITDQPAGGKMMLLDVVGFYVNDDVYSDGMINSKKLDAVGKLGGNDYSKIQEQFALVRPVLDSE